MRISDWSSDVCSSDLGRKMALKHYNPTSPAQRGLIPVDKSALWKGKPVKALTEGKRKSGGRNNTGHVTSRGIAGGHQQNDRSLYIQRRNGDMQRTRPAERPGGYGRVSSSKTRCSQY